MNLTTILFYFFMTLTACGAGAILFSSNVFKSALYLLVSLLSIAALYVFSFAEFLAVTQILIYAGGILVIIVFGIMLTTKIAGRPLVAKNTHLLSGGIAGISLLVIMVKYLPLLDQSDKNTVDPEEISTIGLAIFSTYSLPFEIAGILLLVTLVGAAVVTSHLKSSV